MSVPTSFTWPAGPSAVEVSGDWDAWKDKVALDKLDDGSFKKNLPMAANKRIHYKFIVDGNWTTKEGNPTVDDNGNVNNIVDVGDASAPAPEPAPAPKDDAQPTGPDTTAEKANGTADEIVAGAAAGAASVAAAVGGAAAKLTGSAEDKPSTAAKYKDDAAQPSLAAVTEESKKADPAQTVKAAADGDIRNSIPYGVSKAAQAAVPAAAGAVATVTGADIMRGQPQELTPSATEIKQTQADAAREASGGETVGGYTVDASKAKTENAKAGASTASKAAASNNLDSPAVAIGDAGFAANVDPTKNALGKQGGDAASAVASHGQAGRTAPASEQANAGPAGTAADSGTPATALPGTSAPLENAKPIKQGAPSKETKVAAAAVAPATAAAVANATQSDKILPSTPGKAPAVSRGAPSATAADSIGAEKKGTQTSSSSGKPAGATAKPAAQPATPPKAAPGAVAAPSKTQLPQQQTPEKTKDRTSSGRFGTLRKSQLNLSEESAPSGSAQAGSAGASADSPSGTPERKRKQGLLGKIKSALSPHSSPGKS